MARPHAQQDDMIVVIDEPWDDSSATQVNDLSAGVKP